jgi:hypothetical protein
MCFVQLSNNQPQLSAEYAFHGLTLGRYHVHRNLARSAVPRLL